MVFCNINRAILVLNVERVQLSRAALLIRFMGERVLQEYKTLHVVEFIIYLNENKVIRIKR